eukprot:Hpha_TRINITY_DN18753_c0_g1::TRINITY_DN18753_c0_g1_i1::g.47381::m.47381
MAERGRIVAWFPERRFGFIGPEGGGADIYFNTQAARDIVPQKGLQVQFECSRGGKRACSKVTGVASAAGYDTPDSPSPTRTPSLPSAPSGNSPLLPVPASPADAATRGMKHSSSVASFSSLGSPADQARCVRTVSIKHANVLGDDEVRSACLCPMIQAKLEKAVRGPSGAMLDVRQCCAGGPGLCAVAELVRRFPGVVRVHCGGNRASGWQEGIAVLVRALRDSPVRKQAGDSLSVDLGEIDHLDALDLACVLVSQGTERGHGAVRVKAEGVGLSSRDLGVGAVCPLPAECMDFGSRVRTLEDAQRAAQLLRQMHPHLEDLRMCCFGSGAPRLSESAWSALTLALPPWVVGIECPPQEDAVVAAVRALRRCKGGTVSCSGELT